MSGGVHSYHKLCCTDFLSAANGFPFRYNHATPLMLQVESNVLIEMRRPHLDKHFLLNTYTKHSRGWDEESAHRDEKNRPSVSIKLIKICSILSDPLHCDCELESYKSLTISNLRWADFLPHAKKVGPTSHSYTSMRCCACLPVTIWYALRSLGQDQEQDGKDVELHFCSSWFSSPTDPQIVINKVL